MGEILEHIYKDDFGRVITYEEWLDLKYAYPKDIELIEYIEDDAWDYEDDEEDEEE